MRIKIIIAFAFVITNAFAQSTSPDSLIGKRQKNLGDHITRISYLDSIVIEGYYNLKNIFVKNSFGVGGIGFCVIRTKVNDEVTTDEINANMFQINLSLCKLKLGDKVKVVIKYKRKCAPNEKPLILNPGALLKTNKEETQLSLIYEGKFMWENLFVCNPRVSNSNAYGIKEVLINGKGLSYTEINADVFEINLSKMGLNKEIKEGDKVKIEFKYLKGCDPVIINPEVLH
jgi:hypothetical protein